MVRRIAIVLFVATTARGYCAETAERIIENFTLRDFHGQPHALTDYDDAKLVVVAFLGVECPLANLYAPRLVELARRYEPQGVAFLAIDSNRQDSNSELAAYARAHRIPFAVLKDPGNAVADRFAAQRTPQVFVLDGVRRVRYQGRIDDQYEPGVRRPKPTRNDLAQAIDELLAGRGVSRPDTEAPGCFIGRMAIGREQTGEPPEATVTWSRDIAPIFQRRCQECHRPSEIAPFPLVDYQDVVGWAETIREVVTLERMPPWNANPAFGHFANDLRLSEAEKQAIAAWVDAGAPEGNRDDLPPPRAFVSGWRIGKPDQIVYMSQEPFAVKAEGVVDYQWFYVDPGFTEEKWVRAVEARPGCRAVVHHITVYFKPPGGKWDMQHNARINLLGGFNPGGEPLVLPPGMAMRLPAGTQLAFEMHYTPNGIAERDRSYVGLCFAKAESVRHEVHAYMPADTNLSIPPGASDYASEVRYRFRDAADLLILRPHMHLRGKSFRYEAIYPDGRREVLLDVPRFDFNWQHSYYLAEPKRMPPGATLRCIAAFDNSPENPVNPDPRATVRWGDQSWDEMMIGMFCAVTVDDGSKAASSGEHAFGRYLPLAAGGALLVAAFAASVYRKRRHTRAAR